jgi:putative adenylate-forming enzyme
MADTFDPWHSAAVAADVIAATTSAADLADRRARRLAALLAAARRGSPLYREILERHDDSPGALQDLPVMHKPQLMERFDEWVADPRLTLAALRGFVGDRGCIGQPFLGRYTVWESSGSSGEPGVFVQDPHAMAVYDALEALRRPFVRPLQRLLDPLCVGERVAFVGATDGHFATTVSLERLRRLNPTIAGTLRLVSFLQPTPDLVDELNGFEPTILATYPSAAVMLAEERRAGRLRFAPAEIWTGGETLSAAMRAFIADAFGCVVVNSYGASEFLSLACECRFGCLHLNSDWAVLEAVDADGRPVPPGRAGVTTLLTNLANHVQPIIRYDLGDRVTLHARRCECGSPLPVIEVQGRSDDTLHLPALNGEQVSVLPLALSTVLEEEAGLFDFQLVQERPDRLRLSTVQAGHAGEQALRRARDSLAAFLARQGAAQVHIACQTAVPDLRGRSGKAQRVVSQVAGATSRLSSRTSRRACAGRSRGGTTA